MTDAGNDGTGIARRLVLASRSPRRADLLRAAQIVFDVGGLADVDETPQPGLADPCAIVRELAERKARAAALLAPGDRVLAADTLVFLDGEILGKPADAADARRMLAALSGRTHDVATGVAVAALDAPDTVRLRSGVDLTRVRFRVLSAAEIEAYVETGEPQDKAGAYALQGGAGGFVEHLEGREDTVIGLPIPLVRQLLGAG